MTNLRTLTFDELRNTLDTNGYSSNFYRITAVKDNEIKTVISGEHIEFTKEGLAKVLWWLNKANTGYTYLIEGTVPENMTAFPNLFKEEIEKAQKKAESIKFWF